MPPYLFGGLLAHVKELFLPFFAAKSIGIYILPVTPLDTIFCDEDDA
jgi:hypothetical protein